jgi:hypothetical protein
MHGRQHEGMSEREEHGRSEANRLMAPPPQLPGSIWALGFVSMFMDIY